MAPLNSSAFNSSATGKNNLTVLADGWQDQPEGRGTLDIILSCLLTIFLCSWSAVCLNVPARKKHRWDFLKLKIKWMTFTILFPEAMVSFAAEQWRSARQCVEDFRKLGHSQWSMRHAFFADMGGFHLQTPDFPAFPVDGQQLAYLVDQKHIAFPDIDQDTIQDKNKADGFARAITLVQITWFAIQCFARAIQHLAMSTFELSTLAFVFCSLNMFFFWYHKPLDVEGPIVLQTETKVADILVKAGERAREPYSTTPLDFLGPPEQRTSIIAQFKFGLAVLFDFDEEPDARPVRIFVNSRTTPYRGLTIRLLFYGLLLQMIYFAIHIVGWDFNFPTPLERILWRTASLELLGVLLFYLAFITFGTYFYAQIGRVLFGKEVTGYFDLARCAPRWLLLAGYYPVIAAYVIPRTYILVEAFVSLRALPLNAYTSVQWANFIPHV